MNKSARIIVLVVATLLFGAWLSLIASQHSALLLLGAYLAFLTGAIYLLWSHLLSQSRSFQALAGALVGFAAAIFSAAAAELALRGLDGFLDRDFTPNLYFFPSISFGWLYGAIVIVALCWRRSSTHSSAPRRRDFPVE